MFILTQPHRCDPQHYRFYTTLPEDLGEAVALAKRRHPPNTNADWNLVMSNARRKGISITKQMRMATGRQTVMVPQGEDPAYPLFVATKLIGCLTIKKCVNGAFYEVLSIGKVCQVRDELTGEVWEASPEDLSQCCQLRHAMTYSKCQGQSLIGTVALWDLHSEHFTRRHLYVGISRVRHGSLLFIN